MQSITEKSMGGIPQLLTVDWNDEISPMIKNVMGKKRFHKITFVGTGSSLHVAQWAQWMFRMETDLMVETVSTWDYLASNRVPQDGELFCLITHRGKSGLSETLLNRIVGADHLLFCALESPRGKHPAIFTSKKENSTSHTISLVGSMCALSELLCEFKPKNKSIPIRQQRVALGECLEQFRKDIIKTGFPEKIKKPNESNHYFVGAGVFQSIANETALKFREMAHLPAFSYGLEEILHGPLTGVNKIDTVYLFPSVKPTQFESEKFLYLERMKTLIQSLEKVGCKIIVPRFPKTILNAAQPLAAYWHAMLYLYWGQWTALGVAYQEKVNPDINPYL